MGDWMHKIHVFFALTVAGGEWSASRSGRVSPGERTPCTHWIGGWVDPRAGLDDVAKRKFLNLLGFELRPLGRLVSSQSLYQLRYPCFYWRVEIRSRNTHIPEFIMYCFCFDYIISILSLYSFLFNELTRINTDYLNTQPPVKLMHVMHASKHCCVKTNISISSLITARKNNLFTHCL
jgi:hypothetical protein